MSTSENTNPSTETIQQSTETKSTQISKKTNASSKRKTSTQKPKQKQGKKQNKVPSTQKTSGSHGELAHAVAPSELKLAANTKLLPASTRRVKPIQGFIGQERAHAAIKTALNIHASGYNVFASGRNGLGKRTMIMRLLNAHAASQPTPNDWVYVNNFKYSRRPSTISFPAGQAKPFKETLYKRWHEMLDELKTRFRADRYLTQVDVIRKKISEAQQTAYHELTEEGKQLNLQLVSDDNIHEFVPIEEPFDDSQYVEIPDGESQNQEKEQGQEQLPLDKNARSKTSKVKAGSLTNTSPLKRDKSVSASIPVKRTTSPTASTPSSASNAADKTDTKQAETPKTETTAKQKIKQSKTELENNKRYMQRKLKELSRHLENLEVEANKEIDDLNSEIARDVVEPLLDPLFKEHKKNDAALTYLRNYREDVIENVERILRQEEDDFLPGLFEPIPLRYQINIMVSHEPNSGAPVVFEDMPTHYNLIGHVEQITHMGSVTTDFSLIRTGSLHRANGGFLVLEAMNLLEQPYAWQGIKRALQSKQIKLSSLEQMITLTGSISLEPDTIPLDVKVVLLGEPSLYYELLQLEPEFDSLFKIRADFSDSMPRTAANEETYVQVIADYVRKHELLPFKRDALAALIEDASRQAEEQEELSLHAGTLGQMLLEANGVAVSENAKEVRASHINQTLKDRYYRMGYLRELYWHDLARGHQLISTTGASVGQINALTVIQYADSEFGLPARLTATAYQGNGEILDVERDVNLAGSLHAKGMLIMSSYLRALFGQKNILSFTAALTFEQNYGQIDGDSATLAECCALISALSGIGIDQSWAITGSMNQFGEVQPIGGINAKIEGFYDTCKLQGLTGAQGVIIPAQNKSQLMLRDDVVDAVKRGDFHVYAITHVQDALEKLLGATCGATPAESLKPDVKYPKDSIYGKIMAQLKVWRGEDEEEEKPKKKKKKKKSKDKD